MRIMGHNALAILAAAIAIYAIEFIIFAVMISPPQYLAMSGMTQAQAEAIGMSRMPFGAVMPVLAAIGLSLAIKWRAAAGPVAGATTGLIMGVVFGFGARMYGFVYGADDMNYLAIDFARFLVTYAVGGAIIGAWK